ncbi:MAG: hypothetical protein ACHP84_06480 [Caulobacterales bacterium]
MTQYSVRHDWSSVKALSKFASVSTAALGLALGVGLLASSAHAQQLCSDYNSYGVTQPPNPRNQAHCDLIGPHSLHVTQVTTYHYNGGRGAVPGTITLKGQNSGIVLSFSAHDNAGRRGVPSVDWIVDVNRDLPADRWFIYDSDWNTWSTNNYAGGYGFARMWGTFNAAPAPAPRPRPAPPPGRPALGPGCVYGQTGNITPCYGSVLTMPVTITLTLTRALPAAPAFAKFVIGATSGVTSPVAGAGGLAPGSTYTFPAPPGLCVNPRSTYNVIIYSAAGAPLGSVGNFEPYPC